METPEVKRIARRLDAIIERFKAYRQEGRDKLTELRDDAETAIQTDRARMDDIEALIALRTQQTQAALAARDAQIAALDARITALGG